MSEPDVRIILIDFKDLLIYFNSIFETAEFMESKTTIILCIGIPGITIDCLLI